MKRHFHICFTSHKEVMFRNSEDVRAFINILALASYNVGVRVVLDTEMSNHVHLAVIADSTHDFVRSLRIRYGKYFNQKYHRSGRLGDMGYFALELNGRNHICAAYSYILRNGLHHGVSSSAFGYKYSSIKDIFAKELGNTEKLNIISQRSEIASYLPRHSKFPDDFVMDSSGTFLRKSFEDIYIAENIYGTPRAFLYNMNRLSGEEWTKEQERDGDKSSPVTLSSMEGYIPHFNLDAMLKAEKGYARRAPYLSDFEVCEIIDSMVQRKYNLTSIYQLNSSKKNNLAELLMREHHTPLEQAKRCLAL